MTLDDLRTLVRTHTALLLQAFDALEAGAPQPEPQPPAQWDDALTRRGVTYQPGPGWVLVRAEYREGDAAHGLHHVLIDTLGAQGVREVGVAVRFAWPDGQDTRRTEAKPGEEAALAWPLYAAGNGYSFVVGDGGPRVAGLGLGTIAHPDLGEHVAYYFQFRRTGAHVAVEPEPQPGGANG